MYYLAQDFPMVAARLTGKQNITDSCDVPEGYYSNGYANDDGEPESILIADTYLADMPDYD